jgi:hypothetical protein
MEQLRNEAINKDTKKALLIAAGIIAVGGFAIYNKHQNSIITSLNTRHTNYLNFSDNKINELGSKIIQKDNIIAEQATIIKQLQDENIILQNIKNIQSDKA